MIRGDIFLKIDFSPLQAPLPGSQFRAYFLHCLYCNLAVRFYSQACWKWSGWVEESVSRPHLELKLKQRLEFLCALLKRIRTDAEGLKSAPRASAIETTVDPNATTTTHIPVTQDKSTRIPDYVLELFSVKELNLMVLDPVLLKCVTSKDSIHAMAVPRVHIGSFLSEMKLIDKLFKDKLSVRSLLR
ncbi:hypothetical protein L596_017777 [Steinernema carpocapsae]|uniref:Uncharacterized protein n=1 Tax=Steinernema carpocapsae TaxID=34508 RepID=A0A4U5N2Z1_STECR|nr:hypothetical protein L596_017777 [Steinernema carpocapsae]